jgi:hypothetical protein
VTGIQRAMQDFDQALADLPPERREQLVQLFALVLVQGKGAEESLTPRMREALSGLLGCAVRNAIRGQEKLTALFKSAFASHAPTALALLAQIQERHRAST